ncbi:conjugal transfer protein TraD [Selenomonas sp. oral taxon 126]|uniref:conjugal transfer protein TraD n=1 Tax=Selenomonas sp. oral taxon 126 TaxID=712528 RepID=UPI0008079D58|nr:conjugal transfer protein TraD [Selenomonas sp. oral taxon 126]ANR71842.1 conjugal transfer protein TraD [Selenomonas sp. oral taxon 126]
MQSDIRLSSLVLAALMGVVVVAGMIALRPPLTQMYYVQLGGLIAGAGVVVTLYNYFLTARRRRAEKSAAEESALPAEVRAVDCADDAPPAYAATEETALPVEPVARPAIAVVTELSAAVQEAEPLASASAQVYAEEELPESLDALLDMAYEAAADVPLRAIAAYRRALARYPEDSYMPYLIIELSTLYKRLGDYDAALALFDEALALPLIAKNAVMVQEFERSRRALTVVSYMLTAQGTPTLPFGDVPKEILAEADRRAEGLNI